MGEPFREPRRHLAARWDGARREAEAMLERFRESRLYVQVVVTVALLAAVGVASLAPLGPLARVRDSARWAATADYDFRGQAAAMHRWARDRGGWIAAGSSLGSAILGRIREWVPPPGSERASLQSEGTRVPAAQMGRSNSAAVPGPGAVAAGRQKPQMPLDGPVLTAFGWRTVQGSDQLHEGIDLVAAAGTPVVAMHDGVVTALGTDRALGGYVEVDHGSVVALYAGVSGPKVHRGQVVRRGDVLALVAAEGGAAEKEPPHLHLEVRTASGRVPIDPAAYLGLGGKRL